MNIIRLILLAGIVCLLTSLRSAGHQKPPHTLPSGFWTVQHPDDRVQGSRPWPDAVGAKITVEGIAWGYQKGDPYIILDNARLFILHGFVVEDHGKPVRIFGTLRRRRFKPNEKYIRRDKDRVITFAQQPTGQFDLYFVEINEWHVIDRVSWPWMRVLPERKGADWIGQQGTAAEPAVRLTASN